MPLVAANQPSAAPLVHDAVARGLAFLDAATYPDTGLQSVLACEPTFRAETPVAELRSLVARTYGADLGFDAGPEGFSTMIAVKALAATNAPPLRALCATFADRHWGYRFRFFHRQGGFAADTDCTGVALSAACAVGMAGRALLHGGARAILDAAAPSDERGLEAGVPLVYWEDGREPGVAPRGRKQDLCAAANALHALHLAAEDGLTDARLAPTIDATTRALGAALTTGTWRTRTRYYVSPDTLLCFAGQLVARFPAARIALGGPLRDAVLARCAEVGARGTSIELASRCIAARALGVETRALTDALTARQADDGSWEAAPFFTLGRFADLNFGSRALTTALAVAALAGR